MTFDLIAIELKLCLQMKQIIMKIAKYSRHSISKDFQKYKDQNAYISIAQRV